MSPSASATIELYLRRSVDRSYPFMRFCKGGLLHSLFHHQSPVKKTVLQNHAQKKESRENNRVKT